MSTNWGCENVYDFLKGKVVWHDLRRDEKDLPEISNTLVILLESDRFHGLGRYCEGYHVCVGEYRYFKAEEERVSVGTVTRWAYVPEEVLVLYRKGYFNTCDKMQASFKNKEEFEYYAKQAVRENIPSNAEFVGDYEESQPYDFYSASIYWCDGKYYLTDNVHHWSLD